MSVASSKQERVIQIQREGDPLQGRKIVSGPLVNQHNGNIEVSRPMPESRQGKILNKKHRL